MVPPVGGNNFGIIPPNCMVANCMVTKLVSDNYVCAGFEENGINRVDPLLPRYTILRFRESVL